jgi:hypothetical protein
MANGTQQMAHEPTPAGKDLSDAPMETAAPDTSKPAPPDVPVTASPAMAKPAAGTIRTGFPEPVTPDPPRKPSADGKVILATVAPLGSVTVPPLEEGGETVVITPDGTEVDEETAERALAAAQSGGYKLVQL